MKLSRALPIALTTISVFTTVPAALAAGEPKYESPFVRPAATNANLHLLSTGSAASRYRSTVAVRGEAKNELPFTRVVHLAG